MLSHLSCRGVPSTAVLQCSQLDDFPAFFIHDSTNQESVSISFEKKRNKKKRNNAMSNGLHNPHEPNIFISIITQSYTHIQQSPQTCLIDLLCYIRNHPYVIIKTAKKWEPLQENCTESRGVCSGILPMAVARTMIGIHMRFWILKNARVVAVLLIVAARVEWATIDWIGYGVFFHPLR
jgi:hypothetical protein